MEVRDNDSLGTPEEILRLVRSISSIDLDPCSNAWSTVGAAMELHEFDDRHGLNTDWAGLVANGGCFVNAPYSKPLPWCIRAAHLAIERPAAHVFVLVKNDPTTRWSAVLRASMRARVDFHKRIGFVGGKHKTGQMASTMFYAGPAPYLFAHVFESVGEVRVYR